MTSNAERIRWLRERVEALATEIEESGREDEYLAFVNEVASGGVYRPVDHAEWDVMLEAERRTHLLGYYHAARLELLALQRTLQEEEAAGETSRRKWLTKAWIKENLTPERVAAGTIFLLEVARNAGLFYRDTGDPLD
jgi:hypothetical protein